MHRIPFDRDAKPISAPHARRMLGAAGFDVIRTDFLFLFPAGAGSAEATGGTARGPTGRGTVLVLCRKRA